MRKIFLLIFLLAAGVLTSCAKSAPSANPAETSPTATVLPPTETLLPPTPSPQPTPTREVLYEDDFSDPDSGWEHYVAGDGVLDYQDGGYGMKINTLNNLFWVNAWQTFTDVRIDVDVRKLSETERGAFGVMCRQGEDMRAYLFLISAQGDYGIAILDAFKPHFLGEGEMQKSDAILPELQDNHLTAICDGDTLTLEVNGETLMQVEDDSLTEGDVGLVVKSYDEPGLEVLFDNFIVSKP